jgi:hypothetical protein
MLNTSEIVWSQICVNTLNHGMELVLLLLTHWSMRRWWNAGRFHCCYLSKTRRGEEDINWTSHRWLLEHQSMNWFKGKITGKKQIWYELRVKTMVSCRFYLKPIHWIKSFSSPFSIIFPLFLILQTGNIQRLLIAHEYITMNQHTGFHIQLAGTAGCSFLIVYPH